MSAVTDETLYAYVDGELDAAARSEVERALAAEPALAARVARERALRARLAAAFDPLLDEPVPARLRAVSGAPSTSVPLTHGENAASHEGDSAGVSQLQTARARRYRLYPLSHGPLTWAAWGGLAASLMLGIFLDRFVLAPTEPLMQSDADGRLVAGGALADALAHRRASDPPVGGIAVPVTFRDRRGTWCRSFTTRDRAGLACRAGERWAIDWIAPSAGVASDGALRTAASALPPEILRAIDERIEGAPLDASAEQRAIGSRWAGAL